MAKFYSFFMGRYFRVPQEEVTEKSGSGARTDEAVSKLGSPLGINVSGLVEVLLASVL